MTKKKEIVEEELELYPNERVISIEIEGRKPGLLMHSAKSMLTAPSTKKKSCVHGKPFGDVCDECVEACAYRTDDGELCIPSEALFGTIVNAAGAYKIGRKSARQLIAGCLRIHPYQVSLGTEDYDVDVRTVVIRGSGRVIRHRPWLKEWKASFKMVYDPTFGLTSDVVKEIFEDAGRRIGILDFRPQHKGQFGTFTVTKWDENSV